MKVWDRITLAGCALLRGDENEDQQRAMAEPTGAIAARWGGAAARDAELVADVIRLGKVLHADAVLFDAETGLPMPRDPYREFELKGRREFALELLAFMQMTPEEISQLMESSE